MSTMRLHIHSAKQLVAVCGNGERFLRKSELSKFIVFNQENHGISENGVSVVVDENGHIADLGWTSEVKPTQIDKKKSGNWGRQNLMISVALKTIVNQILLK